MKNKIKTKIVCTIGPSSWTESVLREMYENGMRVARVNGAFADEAELKRVGQLVKSISDEIALMIDIKGHEVRLNKFDKSIPINVGEELIIGQEGDPVYPATYHELYKDVNKGDMLILADGHVELKIKKIDKEKIICEVLFGNFLEPAKSINTPDSKLHNPPITEKDINQIRFATENDWEFVAGSFIRNIDDLRSITRHTEGTNTKVIAKVEDDEGIENINEIIDESDGIMIARGDMGVEIPFEKIPFIQKKIIKLCNNKGKPVITATHMLESMVDSPRPTRAEISDVANAIIDGTDAIMTSAETTKGKYPVKTLETMNRIAFEVESELKPAPIEFLGSNEILAKGSASAAFQVCQSVQDISKILVITESGRTAGLLSEFGLKQEIICFISNRSYKAELYLHKGISNVIEYNYEAIDKEGILDEVLNYSKNNKLVKKGQKVLLMGKIPSKTTSYPNVFEIVDI